MLVLAAVAKIVGQPERGHDQHGIDRHAPPFLTRGLSPQFLFLPFSALLRHGVPYIMTACVETGLAPSFFAAARDEAPPVSSGTRFFTPPPAARPAALRSLGTPASAPRRPPSHPPAHQVETRPAEPPAVPPADAGCACHHRASPGSGSAPVVQSAPTAHTRSIRHRWPRRARSSWCRP